MKSPNQNIILYLSIVSFLLLFVFIIPTHSCTITRYTNKHAEQVIDAILKRLESYASSIEKKRAADDPTVTDKISENVVFGIPITDKNDFFMDKKVKIVDLLQVIGYDHIHDFEPSRENDYYYWTLDAELNYQLLLHCIRNREENILKNYMPLNGYDKRYQQKIELVTFFMNPLKVAKTIVHLTKAYISNTFDQYLNHYDLSEMSKWELVDEDYEKYMGTQYKLIIKDPFAVRAGPPPEEYFYYCHSDDPEEGQAQSYDDGSEYDENLPVDETPKTESTPSFLEGAKSEGLYEDEMKNGSGYDEYDGYDYTVDEFDEEELMDDKDSQYPSKPPLIPQEYEDKIVYSYDLGDLAYYYTKILDIYARRSGVAAVQSTVTYFEPSNSFYVEQNTYYSPPANEDQYMKDQNSSENTDTTAFHPDPTS